MLGPLARVMRYEDQSCLGLFLLELCRHKEGHLGDQIAGDTQREITDFFEPHTQQSDEQASQQTSESTRTRGILTDKASELG